MEPTLIENILILITALQKILVELGLGVGVILIMVVFYLVLTPRQRKVKVAKKVKKFMDFPVL